MFPDAHGDPSRSDAGKLRWDISGDDLEIALYSAERMLAQAEDRRRYEQNRVVGLTSLLLFILLSMFASIFGAVQSALYFDTASVVATGGTAAVTAILSSIILRSITVRRRRTRRDVQLYLAARLGRMVSDVLLDVAARERWSYFRVETCKLRLSAFPLIETLDRERERGFLEL